MCHRQNRIQAEKHYKRQIPLHFLPWRRSIGRDREKTILRHSKWELVRHKRQDKSRSQMPSSPDKEDDCFRFEGQRNQVTIE
jgi:hypothetical protein